MTRKTLLVFMATTAAATFAVACDDDRMSDVAVIRSGWFNGQCGTTYCEGDVSITRQTTTFTAEPRSGSMEPPLVVSEVTPSEVWRALERQIDTLPDENVVIGCPGCADEGVEWIEVERSGEEVNVHFNCGATLAGAEGIQAQIRAVRDRLAAMTGLGGFCMESRYRGSSIMRTETGVVRLGSS